MQLPLFKQQRGASVTEKAKEETHAAQAQSTLNIVITMPPVDTTSSRRTAARNYLPRLIVYHQTHYHQHQFVSMLPLARGGRKTTHIIIAAIHLNATPGDITLNDDPWDASNHARLWDEVRQAQVSLQMRRSSSLFHFTVKPWL